MAEPELKRPDAMSPLTEANLERYAAALGRYLARRAPDAQNASDMVQEIFARFLRKKDRPEVLRNPFGYLLGFARNVLLESLSSEYHNPIVYNSELVDALGQQAEDVSLEPLAERFALNEELTEALSKLPEAHLLALMLVDGQGMTYAEAAKASGFTKATIATYVMHARAGLRQILPEYWGNARP